MSLFGKPDIKNLLSQRNVNGLLKALNYNNDVYVRMSSANALGEIGDIKAIEPLIAALRDPFFSVRNAAANALKRLGWHPDKNEIGANYWVSTEDWEKCLDIGGLAILPLVETMLTHYSEYTRMNAATTLGKIGSSQAVKPLIFVLLNDKVFDVRMHAAEALGQIGDVDALAPLLSILQVGENPDMYFAREAAAIALGKIGSKEAVDVLVNVAIKEESGIRSVALKAIGNIGAYNVLADLLKNPKVSKYVAEILNEIGFEPTKTDTKVRLLLELKNWEELEKLGKVVVPTLIKAASKHKDDRLVIIETLARIGDKTSANVVLDYLFEHPVEFSKGVVKHSFYNDINSKTTYVPNYNFEHPIQVTLSNYFATYAKLFDNYTELVLKVAGYNADELLHNYEWTYPFDEVESVIRKLCSIVSPVSNNLLHKVANKRNIEVRGILTDYGWKLRVLNFESMRELARIELINRGNPEYDPYSYLSVDEWKI
jgi:HEAT repeat protein